jgi:hypothetical protein
MPKIIGLLARAGRGKSTCAAVAAERGFRRHSLAGPLKELVRHLFDFRPSQVYGTQAEKEAVDPRWGVSPREMMIRLGDGARRCVGEDVWLRACLDKIATEGHDAVIEDVRYGNEAAAIVAAGGAVVKLDCPDAETLVDPDAPSERSVDQVPPLLITKHLVVPRSTGAQLLKAEFGRWLDEWLRGENG